MADITHAVIVAAGCSSRLYPRTLNTPKGLLPLGDTSILGRSIALLRAAGINRICIVTGFCRDQIQDSLGDEGIDYLFNPFYKETNNMGSLWFARDWIARHAAATGCLYMHSDIAYHEHLLDDMMRIEQPDEISLLVDDGPVDEEAMKVEVDADGSFVRSSKRVPLDLALGEWVGMAGFGPAAIPGVFQTIEALLEAREFMVYDTRAFNQLAQRGQAYRIVPTRKLPWIEIDFETDYAAAQNMFA